MWHTCWGMLLSPSSPTPPAFEQECLRRACPLRNKQHEQRVISGRALINHFRSFCFSPARGGPGANSSGLNSIMPSPWRSECTALRLQNTAQTLNSTQQQTLRFTPRSGRHSVTVSIVPAKMPGQEWSGSIRLPSAVACRAMMQRAGCGRAATLRWIRSIRRWENESLPAPSAPRHRPARCPARCWWCWDRACTPTGHR